jgi:RNA polymerase sigma-70 factor (ECF subfamily)
VRDEWENLTDERLALECQGGSLAEFEELVHRYEQRIYNFVLRSCYYPHDAEEITQDTFVRAFQAISKFDASRKFAPWLFSIARRKCIDHFRANSHREKEPEAEMTCHDDPAELLARQEEKREFWRLARRSLPQIQFQALWLRYVEDMELEDVAKALGKTRIHVKVLLFRARQALGKAIREDYSSANSSDAQLAQKVCEAQQAKAWTPTGWSSALRLPALNRSMREQCASLGDFAAAEHGRRAEDL